MLQFIRDRATGWIAWVIIILICIPFALWGVNQYFEPDQGLVVASVDDSEISYEQYRSAVQQQRAQLQQMLGGNISQDLLDSPELREQVLQSLVDAEAVLRGAVKTGLRIGDAHLASAIRTMQAFQVSGQFSSERYNSVLRSQGISSQGFEFDLRRSLLTEQLRSAFRQTAIVTSAEVDRSLRIRNEQRVIKLLNISPDALRVQTPDEAAIKARYEGKRELYMQPEQVSIRYIELSRDDIAKTVTVTDEELRAIYEQRKEHGNYGQPEQREARHILVEVSRDASSDEDETARAAIDLARKRIVDGEDFAAVAKDVSQDLGSASVGGELGQFGRGVMDPAFEEAAFTLAQNVVSEPVRTTFGWHLIEITAIHEAKVRSFEDVRDEVLSEYQIGQADEIFAEDSERLATIAFEHPESLEVAAETLGLSVLDSGFFSLSGEQAAGLTANPRVRAAAFSSDVLEAGNNSDLIELDGERRVVLRVANRKAARQKSLDEVRDEIIAALSLENSTEQANAMGERVLEGLQQGTDLAALLKDAAADLAESNTDTPALDWSENKTLARDTAAGVPDSVAKLAFRMRAPAENQVNYAGTALPGGGFAIVALSAVQQAPSTLSDDEKKGQRARLSAELQGSEGEQTFSAVRKSLRRQADVVIKQQNLRPDQS